VRAAKNLVIGMIAVLALSGDLGLSAYASRHKYHPPKAHKTKQGHYKADKNAYLVGGKFKAPKKQKLPKGSHRDPITGGVVYGKQ
jgi:hypothetical protein